MIKMVSIKIISIGLAFFLIKFITFLFIMIFILINKESEDILSTEKYDCEDRVGNYSFRPINIFSTPDELPIATMLYYKYWNEVFNLTYLKIVIGRKNFWFKILKKINFKSIIRIIFYFFTGLNKIFIDIAKLILNYKKKEKIENLLFKKFINILDDRLIIKIKGEWAINGFVSETTNIVKKILINKNTLSTSSIESKMPYIHMIVEKHNNKMMKDFFSFKMKQGFFKNRITNKTHEHILEINKDPKNVGYITDYEKANNNGNYDLNVMLEKVELKKTSKVLEIPKKEIYMFKQEKFKNPFPFLESARNNYYDENSISDNLIEQISDYKEIRIDLYLDLKEIIPDESTLKEVDEVIVNELIKNFTKAINNI